MRKTGLILSGLLLSTLTPGCNDDPPPPAPPEAGQSTSMPGTPSTFTPPRPDRPTSTTPLGTNPPAENPQPPADPSRAAFAGLVGPIPVTWQWQPPRNNFRVAQWMVPGRDGGEPAEMVVTTFPEAPGNNVANNVERWSRQFRSPDGAPPQAEVESFVANGLPVTLVSLEGEYLGMGGGFHKESYRMIVAMVKAPVGSVFVKLLGPAATVDANQDSYANLISNLEVESPQQTP